VTMLPVHTPVFEGPLDLLLHLIERADLDITTVSLVQVTDQYIAALRAQDRIDLRALADFVAVGARLLLLKSRALLPRPADEMSPDDEQIEALATDLTAQLEEYRAYKDAATYLRELDATGHRSFTRVAPPPADRLPTGLETITMNRLLAALSTALERLPANPEPQRLPRQSINVAELRRNLLGIVRGRGAMPFSRLIADCRTRLEAIVTFMAILDLLKTEELHAEQSASFGEIVISSHSPEAAATA
jgi:segregation and condensation protein A